MIRRPPRSTRTDTTLSLHDALPIYRNRRQGRAHGAGRPGRRLAGGGDAGAEPRRAGDRSEEHTSELQSLMRISYAVFCLKKKKAHYLMINTQQHTHRHATTN